MKTVLRGGPQEGEVIDAKRGQFGTGEIKELYDKDNKLIGRSPNYKYSISSEWERHPCKKRGVTNVFRYAGPDMEKAILPEKMSDRAKLRPTNFEKMTPEEQWEVDKALGILDWDGD